MMNIRPPAVAGTLYEADTQRLLAQVEAWLEQGIGKTVPTPPKALIVPHSSYHYSGPTASAAYRLLEPVYDSIRRVVLVGPSHRASFNGIALPGSDCYKTPLGEVRVDADSIAALRSFEFIHESSDTHRLEHSLEVQLPFLQTVLEDFALVPLIVGNIEPEALAAVLNLLWGERETLIVISTGLSRKQPYDTIVAQDDKSVEQIRACDPHLRYEQACGYQALNGFLMAAQDKHLNVKCLHRSTSTDVNGKKENVRGFGAFAFY